MYVAIKMVNFSTNKFVVQLSRDVSAQLKRYLQEQKSSTVIINTINNHIQIEVHDGPGRTLAQVRSTAGGLLGEATRSGERSGFFPTRTLMNSILTLLT